jgi:NitT/TauT family transport system ATP-binding protein
VSSSPYLHIKKLKTKYYSELGELVALEHIDLTVDESEFVCIIGPSGCGKSTLLRVVAGLVKPTEGQVLWKGHPVSGPSARIGMVFQQGNLLPWRSVRENISLPFDVSNNKASGKENLTADLIKRVGLVGFENELPHNLSGGMVQRTAIARVLAQNPELLLLDEPFGQLDAITRESMGNILLQLWEQDKRTVLMVTHDVEEAALLADRIVVLSNRPGRIIDIIPVPIERPRQHTDLSDATLQQIARSLRYALHRGMVG